MADDMESSAMELEELRLGDREALSWELEIRRKIWRAALVAVRQAQETGCSPEEVLPYLGLAEEEMHEARRACRLSPAGIEAYLIRFEGDLAAMSNAQIDEDVGAIFEATAQVQQWMGLARCAWVRKMLWLAWPAAREGALLPDARRDISTMADIIESRDVSRDAALRYDPELDVFLDAAVERLGALNEHFDVKPTGGRPKGRERAERPSLRLTG